MNVTPHPGFDFNAAAGTSGVLPLSEVSTLASPQSVDGSDPLIPTSLDSQASTARVAQMRRVLTSMAQSGTRPACVESLASGLMELVPGATIRCAIGSKQLLRFFDARLGWLGPESALHQVAARRWNATTVMNETTWSDGEILIPLHRSGRSERGWISISSGNASEELATQLSPWAETIAAILWSRPKRSLPAPLTQWTHLQQWAIAAAVLLLIAFGVPARYRVACTVRVEPLSSRTIAAPFEAVIEEVFAYPGDMVTVGQTLVKLDGRPLRLERQSLDAELQQIVKQKDIAMAASRVAEAQQAQLRYQQLLRQRDLIDRRLEQLNVVSPLAGVVVHGDLRRAIGAPLELGRSLMEIAPLDRVLIEVEIPESEISMVADSSPAKLRVDASGTSTMKQSLAEIHPAGELRDDRIVFIAPLEISNADGAFRPGMTGKATVYGNYRPLAWPYVRKAVDQVTWLIGL